MSSLDKQRTTILTGNAKGSRMGKLDADLNPTSTKNAIAATENFWVQLRGIRDDKLCFRHQVEMSGSKRQIMDNSDDYLKTLRRSMVVVQAHDALDDKTPWEKRATTDLRSAERIGEQVEAKRSRYLENEDGTAKVYHDGTITYELCTVMPAIGPNTRYLTIRMAPNSDGQQLFVWSIEARDVADGGAEPTSTTTAPDAANAPAGAASRSEYRAPGNAPTVIAALTAAGNYTTFLKLLSETGVDAELAGAGPFTVLAATDDAFAAWPPKRLPKLLADKAKLTKYVRRQILVGAYPPSADIVKLDARTLGESKYPIATTPNGVRVSGTELGKPIAAKNGLVYKLDEAPPP